MAIILLIAALILSGFFNTFLIRQDVLEWNFLTYLLLFSFTVGLAASQITSSFILTEQHSKYYLIFNITVEYLSLFSGLLTYLLTRNVFFLILGISIGYLLPNIWTSYFWIKSYGVSKVSPQIGKKILKFGAPYLLSRTIISVLPVFMYNLILIHFSISEVAIFSVALALSSMFKLVVSNFLFSFFIYVTDLSENTDQQELSRYYVKKIFEFYLLFSLLFCTFLITASPYLVLILSSQQYLAAVKFIPYLVITKFFITTAEFVGVGMFTKEKQVINTSSKSFSLLLFWVFAILSINNLGMTAILIGYFIFGISSFLLSFFFGRRYIKIEIDKLFALKYGSLVLFEIILYFILDWMQMHVLITSMIMLFSIIILYILMNLLRLNEIKEIYHLLLKQKSEHTK